LRELYSVPAPELLLEPLRCSIKPRELEKSANEVPLKISNLRTEAGVHGAARLISEIVVEKLLPGSLNASQCSSPDAPETKAIPFPKPRSDLLNRQGAKGAKGVEGAEQPAETISQRDDFTE
jgi:hypothetical protein